MICVLLCIELIISVMSETGVALNTVYTGKTLCGMLREMEIRPERFQGNRVLSIHTGMEIQA